MFSGIVLFIIIVMLDILHEKYFHDKFTSYCLSFHETVLWIMLTLHILYMPCKLYNHVLQD